MAKDVKPTRKELMQIEDRIGSLRAWPRHPRKETRRAHHGVHGHPGPGPGRPFRPGRLLRGAPSAPSTWPARWRATSQCGGAAAALKEHPEITTQSKNIMGVVVPQIESSKVRKSLDERGYGVMGTSARIDEAADSYERLIENIILAAEVETAMKKMLEEIRDHQAPRQRPGVQTPAGPLRQSGVHRAETRRARARGDLPDEEDQSQEGRRGEGRARGGESGRGTGDRHGRRRLTVSGPGNHGFPAVNGFCGSLGLVLGRHFRSPLDRAEITTG